MFALGLPSKCITKARFDVCANSKPINTVKTPLKFKQKELHSMNAISVYTNCTSCYDMSCELVA